MRKFLIVLFAIAQNILAIVAIVNLANMLGYNGQATDESNAWSVTMLMCFAIDFVLSFFVCRLREMDDEFGIVLLLYVLFDFALSPFAFIRILLGLFLRFKDTKFMFIVPNNPLYISNKGDVFRGSMQLLIYRDFGSRGASETTGWKNLCIQLFILTPLAALMTLGWLAIFGVFPGFKLEVFGIIGVIYGILFLSYVYSIFKISSVYVEHRSHWYTTVYNKHGRQVGFYDSGAYDVNAKGRKKGFYAEQTYDESGHIDSVYFEREHEEITNVFVFLCSPILGFTQAFGTLMAIVALFCPFIYSSYGAISTKNVPGGFIQMPFAFLCSFVIQGR